MLVKTSVTQMKIIHCELLGGYFFFLNVDVLNWKFELAVFEWLKFVYLYYVLKNGFFKNIK